MRAVVIHDHGSGPSLAEVETPHAGPGEVRVKVRASSLNGLDLAIAAGYAKDWFQHEFPVVLGRDFAGTVDEVGDGVTGFAVGDDVFGVVLTQPLHAGGFGEYVIVPEDHSIAPMPDGLDHSRAGAIGLAAAAATAVVGKLEVQPGETVLVVGATGGVGAVAVQRLAAAGATVIATAGSDAEAEHVRGLGAHHIVDHTGDLAAQVHAIAPNGVDAAAHLAGDPAAVADLVTNGGRLATLIALSPEPFDGRPITAHMVAAYPTRAMLEGLGADVAAGRLRIPIQRSYQLDEVPQALADFAGGTVGKLSVNVS